MKVEVALIGVDGAGKSKAGEAINNAGLSGVKLIKVTNYEYSGLFLRNLGNVLDSSAEFGDRLNSKLIAGISYLGSLLLSPLARMRSKNKVVVWERHPLYDTQVYAEIYSSTLGKLGKSLERIVKKGIQSFHEPEHIIYLKTDIETALQRINQDHRRQIHENPEDLEKVIEYFDSVVTEAKASGYPEVTEIETDNKNVEEVNEEVISKLEQLVQQHVKQELSLRERGRELLSRYNPLSPEKLYNTIDDLVERGTMCSEDVILAEQLVDEQTYTSYHLAFCAATSLITPPEPTFSLITSTPIRTAWNLSWLIREISKRDWSKVGIHLSALPLIWIPKIGGISYLVPLCLKSPEAGMLYAYHICKSIPFIKKYPDEVMESIGHLYPFRKTVPFFDTLLGREAQGSDYKLQLEMRPSALAPKDYITNFRKTFRLVFGDLMIPYFLKGARKKD